MSWPEWPMLPWNDFIVQVSCTSWNSYGWTWQRPYTTVFRRITWYQIYDCICSCLIRRNTIVHGRIQNCFSSYFRKLFFPHHPHSPKNTNLIFGVSSRTRVPNFILTHVASKIYQKKYDFFSSYNTRILLLLITIVRLL
jgi:hypothetical protein